MILKSQKGHVFLECHIYDSENEINLIRFKAKNACSEEPGIDLFLEVLPRHHPAVLLQKYD